MVKDDLKRLYEILKEARYYEHALAILSFDFETIVPNDAREEESAVIDHFDNEIFKLMNSSEYKSLIERLHQNKDQIEDELDKTLVDILYKNYVKEKNLSPEFALKMSNTFSKAYIDWIDAKEKNDYRLFEPALKAVIDIKKKAIEKRDNKLADLYDNMLNDCEEGLLQEDLDPFFNELKAGLLNILNKIKNSKHQIRHDFLNRKVQDYQQKEMANYLLELNGYDFNRGVLSETEHPFTMDISQFDARVTTHYYDDMVLSSIYSVIHEGGHAIFMQNEPEEDHKHYINDEISNGMHESVSRFYENVIGRSKEYVHLIYPKFKEIFKPTFDDVTEEELYEAINIVEPSLIRTEADEVTYGLHIIIRYEMEKGICSGKIKLEDISKTWNQLYKEYLGVEVPDEKQGVLQDVHWTGGFGYFPSYAIGNCYNQMYLKEMEKEFSLAKAIENQEFEKIKEWMKNHVFLKANRLTPKEWIKDLTGESLTPKYFLEYLDKKYKDIYKY